MRMPSAAAGKVSRLGIFIVRMSMAAAMATTIKQAICVAVILACSAAGNGNRLNLHADVLRESGYLHRGPRRPGGAETIGVDAVHLREVLHAAQINSRLHHPAQRGAGLLQDGLEVGKNARRLLGYPPLDYLSAGRIDGDLSGDEDETVGHDGLRIGPDCLRRLVCRYGVNHKLLLESREA